MRQALVSSLYISAALSGFLACSSDNAQPCDGGGSTMQDGTIDSSTGMDATMDGALMDGALTDGASDAGSDVADAAADSPPPKPAICKMGLPGPQLIDAGSFCIDETEVTQSQYLAFLQSKNGNTSGQPPECSWNANYGVSSGCLNQWDPMGAGKDLPVGGVDWCDAYMYCAWAGKRLCGSLADGGADFGLPQDKKEWFSGCSNFNDGLHKYPYGDTFDPYACNGLEAEGGAPANVGTFTKCAGGVNGLKDMMGNHWEFANDCELWDPDGGPNPASQSCDLHGGSYYDTLKTLPCSIAGYNRSAQNCHVGLRCCASN